MRVSRLLVVVALVSSVGMFGFAAGQGEDSLLVYSAGPGDLARDVVAGFEEETGIDVNLFQATTGDVLGRLEAEADNPQADVVILASWPAAFSLQEQGWLEPYRPANADKLPEEWIRQGDYFFGPSASALGVVYNTDALDDPGSDWSDYAEERFRDVVRMPDPAQSGSALDFIAGYIYNFDEDGYSLFEAMIENGLEVAGPNRPALDSVVTAANYVVLAGVDYMAYGAMQDGSPINVFYPESGTVVNPRPAMMTSWSENKDNARLFLDYYLSEEAQEIVADYLLLPGRQDVAVHPDRVGLDEIPTLDLDWDWMAENQEDILDRFQRIIR